MFSNYEINFENNEEVLYLYLDIDSEFAKLKGKKNNKKIKGLVKEYIKKNNIAFNGKKVVVLVGGIMATTLLLSKNPLPNNKNIPKNENYAISLKMETPKIKEETNLEEGIKIEEKVEIKQEDPKKEVSNQNKKPNNVVKKPAPSKSPTTEVKKPIEAPKKEPIKEVVPDNNTYVTIKRSNGSFEKYELEEYVIGVVGAEMPASFHNEALKAQAIIARTYALKALETGKELTDNSSTQNFKTVEQLKKTWGSSFNTYYNKIKNAVNSTKGMYLTYNGEIIEAMYHSTSNGQTENAEYVWGNAFPYLVSVESTYDTGNSTFKSTKFISYNELSQKFGFEINENTEINILSKTAGNRIFNIKINDQEFTGVNIRNLLGLKSADFEIEKNDQGITFTTKGFGHGVGLSQYGANGMAKNGSNYKDILLHYYKGVKLVHL